VETRIETLGFVRLAWCMYRKNVAYNSTFLVSKEFDPWFDVLLGNDTISEENISYLRASEAHSKTLRSSKLRKGAQRRSRAQKTQKQKDAKAGQQRAGQSIASYCNDRLAPSERLN